MKTDYVDEVVVTDPIPSLFIFLFCFVSFLFVLFVFFFFFFFFVVVWSSVKPFLLITLIQAALHLFLFVFCFFFSPFLGSALQFLLLGGLNFSANRKSLHEEFCCYCRGNPQYNNSSAFLTRSQGTSFLSRD